MFERVPRRSARGGDLATSGPATGSVEVPVEVPVDGDARAGHEEAAPSDPVASPVRRRALARVEAVRALEASRSTAWAGVLHQVAALVDDVSATGGPAAPLAGDAGSGADGWGSDVGRAEEAAAAEVALALTMPLSSAHAVVHQAVALCTVLPVTMAALEGGRVDQVRARVVVDETSALGDDQARAVDAQLDPCLGPLTASQLRARIRHLVATTDAAAVRRRARRATCVRGVRLFAAPDGMAQLVATGPGSDLAVVFDRLTATARGREGAHGRVDPHAATAAGLDPLALPEGSAGLPDRRGMDARRFDALVDLATTAGLPAPDGAGGAARSVSAPGSADRRHGPQVVVALTSLVGLDDEPAQLAGQGPVPVEQVRELLGAGHRFRRALTDPVTGQLIGLDGHLMAVGRPTDDGADDRRTCEGSAAPDPEPHRAGLASDEHAASALGGTSRADPDDAPPAVLRPEPPPDERGDASPPIPVERRPSPAPRSPRRTLRPPSRGHCPVLAAGGGAYAPARGCDRFVRARASRCQAPGCRVPAARCDLDHRRAHAVGGPTCPCNLDVLCRRHHLAKHRFGWSAVPTSTDPRDAGLRWTSPLGQTADVPGEPLLPRPVERTPTPQVAPDGPARERAAHRPESSPQQPEDVRYARGDEAAHDARRTRAELDRQQADARAARTAAAEAAERDARRAAEPPPF